MEGYTSHTRTLLLERYRLRCRVRRLRRRWEKPQGCKIEVEQCSDLDGNSGKQQPHALKEERERTRAYLNCLMHNAWMQCLEKRPPFSQPIPGKDSRYVTSCHASARALCPDAHVTCFIILRSCRISHVSPYFSVFQHVLANEGCDAYAETFLLQ